MAEDTWQLTLDPNDEKSWRKGGGAQGKGVIVDEEYELWGYPPKQPGKQLVVQVFAVLTIAFDNMDRLWRTHYMAAWTPNDKDPKTGLAPSLDGIEPAGGSWDRVIAVREGREALPPDHPFRGPLVARRGNAQFSEDEQFYQCLKRLSEASLANLAAGEYSLHVATPGGGARVAPGNFGLDIRWLHGLECDWMNQDSIRQMRPKTKKTSVLAEASAADESKGPVQVLCPLGLFGRKTPEETEAIKKEYLAREAANTAPASSTGVAPGSITSSAPATSSPVAAKGGGSKKKMDLSAELVAEFNEALVAALSADSCKFEVDGLVLEHTGLRGSLMSSIVPKLSGVAKKTGFAYWIEHELPGSTSDRWEYDASTNLISLKG